MTHEDFTLTSAADGQLFGHLWKSSDKPKALIILVHGFGEHCIRYTPYIELFEKEDISFISMDHIGHGQSDGKRGVIQSYQQLLDDIDTLIAKAERVFPEVPKFLYGHSMGGNIAFNHLLQRKNFFKAAIISSPWLQLTKEPNKISKIIINIFYRIFPNVTVNSGLDSKYISSKDKEVDEYDHDVLNHSRISFRLLKAITDHGIWAIKNSLKLNTPTLLLHGNKDQVTSHLASKKVAASCPKMITYHELKDAYHEIHNDDAREELSELCIAFIKQKLGE